MSMQQLLALLLICTLRNQVALLDVEPRLAITLAARYSTSTREAHLQETHHLLEIFDLVSNAGDLSSPGQAQAGITRRLAMS